MGVEIGADRFGVDGSLGRGANRRTTLVQYCERIDGRARPQACPVQKEEQTGSAMRASVCCMFRSSGYCILGCALRRGGEKV